MPNALAEAVGLYGDLFSAAHGWYTANGYTYTTPECILLFRPCRKSDYAKLCSLEEADCWWVELAIGSRAPGVLAIVCPHPLPYVGWQRGIRDDPKPRFFPFQKAKNLYELHQGSRPSSRASSR